MQNTVTYWRKTKIIPPIQPREIIRYTCFFFSFLFRSASINYVVIEKSSASVRGCLVIKIHGCIALSRVRLMWMDENEIKRETFWSLSKISREILPLPSRIFYLLRGISPRWSGCNFRNCVLLLCLCVCGPVHSNVAGLIGHCED